MRWSEDMDRQWHEETEAVLSGLKDWRAQHATATFREIETAVDDRLNGLRARMVERLALASAATVMGDQPTLARPTCGPCGLRLTPRGTQTRQVLTQGNQPVQLERAYGVCPTCRVGRFPPR